MPGRYTIISYEGDGWVADSKPHAWRWQNEATIYLADGRAFSSLDEARAANGPQYVEVRAPDTVAGLTAVQANPAIAAFVRSLYSAYFGRAADAAGLEFWTNEIATGRNTQAGVQAAFASDKEAVDYAARLQANGTAGSGGALPQPVIQPPTAITPQGFLNSKVFGIDMKLIIVGGIAAYFLLGEK